ncbi:MAG: GNAT family N-acetyltransferase [Pseudomonadota bacterium]
MSNGRFSIGVLSGDSLTLEPIQPSHWEGLYAAAADPGIWAQHPASDRYQEAVFRQYFDDALASGLAFAVVHTASGEIIGSSRYAIGDTSDDEIEIGWTFLARAFWGGVTNRELKHLMVHHAFECFETVVFWIGESNRRSRRAVEKLGASLRPGSQVRGGSVHVVYALSKADWQQSGTT